MEPSAIFSDTSPHRTIKPGIPSALTRRLASWEIVRRADDTFKAELIDCVISAILNLSLVLSLDLLGLRLPSRSLEQSQNYADALCI